MADKPTMPTRDEIESACAKLYCNSGDAAIALTDMLNRIADAMDGCVVVPLEPTVAMIEAAERRDDDEPASDWGKIRHAPFDAIYKAMLAAAQPENEHVER